MKKVLLTMLGMVIASGVYAESYTMYAKADTKSTKMGKVDNQNPEYSVIFSKDGWIELVNEKTGQVGWVEQETAASQPKGQAADDSIEEMMAGFQAQQKSMQQHFNNVIKNIDNNIAEIQPNVNTKESISDTTKEKPKIVKKFKSVTINSDGKTAKIVEKIDNGNGKVETIEKDVPASDLEKINFNF